MIRPEHRTWSIVVLMLVGVGLSVAGCKDSSNPEIDQDAASDEDAAVPEKDAGQAQGDAGMDAATSDAATQQDAGDAASGGGMDATSGDTGAGDGSADDAAADDASHGGHDADASPADAGSDAASASDAAGDGGGDAGPLAPTCSAYCSLIKVNCMAANQQYLTDDICMAVCTSFPPGTVGATSGNTLGCRLTHAGFATGAGATTHCHHAGITGGDLDPTDTTPGTCGEGCDAFCNEALVACTNATTPGGTAPYASKEACMTECKMFPAASSNFSTAATSGNTFHCRAYHLTAASKAPDPHCGHIKLSSPTCN